MMRCMLETAHHLGVYGYPSAPRHIRHMLMKRLMTRDFIVSNCRKWVGGGPTPQRWRHVLLVPWLATAHS